MAVDPVIVLFVVAGLVVLGVIIGLCICMCSDWSEDDEEKPSWLETYVPEPPTQEESSFWDRLGLPSKDDPSIVAAYVNDSQAEEGVREILRRLVDAHAERRTADQQREIALAAWFRDHADELTEASKRGRMGPTPPADLMSPALSDKTY